MRGESVRGQLEREGSGASRTERRKDRNDQIDRNRREFLTGVASWNKQDTGSILATG